MNGCNLDSARLKFKMRAGRAAGTENSAVRVSMCAGTCRPQSRFSPSSVLGHYIAPNRCVPNPAKVWLFRWKIPALLWTLQCKNEDKTPQWRPNTIQFWWKPGIRLKLSRTLRAFHTCTLLVCHLRSLGSSLRPYQLLECLLGSSKGPV